MAHVKLTAKQEAFCQAIANGSGQADAYRSAYDASGMKDTSIYPVSARMMKNAKIAARIAEIRATVAEVQLWTRTDSVKGLMAAFDIAKDAASPRGMTAAVKELNVMHGFNEATRIDLTGNVDITGLSDAAKREIARLKL